MAKNNPVALEPLGVQRISLSNSTALGLNTTTIPGKVFCLSVETNNLRWRGDGTNPTLTTGVLLTTGNSPYWVHNLPGSNMKFQRSTGTCVVNVISFKYRGE